MNDREMFTRESAAESPAVPGCWRRTDLHKQLHREDNVLHTLQNCAASPYSRRCRLGVGARCRNASVKLERRRDWAVSGASFQNKCQFERWRLSSVSVLYVIKCSRNATFISGLLGIPKLLFTLCLCEFDLKNIINIWNICITNKYWQMFLLELVILFRF